MLAMFMIDPIYLVFIAPGLLLSLWASYRVKSMFSKYSEVEGSRGLTGAEAAQHLLDRAGITDVSVVPASGFLSDHYNPVTKELALSEAVYSSRSIAAIGVAAHEAGHAIQHAVNYFPLWLRSALVPTASLGSSLGYIAMALGLFMSMWVFWIGVGLFTCVLLFQVVTLPVEFDASRRAKELVVEAGIIHPMEREGMDRVLGAAAMTYVAAVVSTLLVLLYYLYRAGVFGAREER